MARYKVPVYDKRGKFTGNAHYLDYGKDWDGPARAKEIVKRTSTGHEYVEFADYFAALDDAALAAEERAREEERQQPDPPQMDEREMHMQWALTMDPNLTPEDYWENVRRCPGYGPRSTTETNMIEKPIRPRMRGSYN